MPRSGGCAQSEAAAIGTGCCAHTHHDLQPHAPGLQPDATRLRCRHQACPNPAAHLISGGGAVLAGVRSARMFSICHRICHGGSTGPQPLQPRRTHDLILLHRPVTSHEQFRPDLLAVCPRPLITKGCSAGSRISRTGDRRTRGSGAARGVSAPAARGEAGRVEEVQGVAQEGERRCVNPSHPGKQPVPAAVRSGMCT